MQMHNDNEEHYSPSKTLQTTYVPHVDEQGPSPLPDVQKNSNEMVPTRH